MTAKIALERIREVVEKQNGVLLSTVYINSRQHLQLSCKEGHIWKAAWNNLRSGSWCPTCAKNKRSAPEISYQSILDLINSKNGILLTSECKLVYNTKIELQCDRGHSWQTIVLRIKNGNWCARCSNDSRMLDIEVYQKIAQERGGECLSATCKSAHEKLLWKCAQEHTWLARAATVKNNKSWCPTCVKQKPKSQRINYYEMQIRNIIEKRGGRLTGQYQYGHTPTEIVCSKGHQWRATPKSIKRGTWCPVCYVESRSTLTK